MIKYIKLHDITRSMAKQILGRLKTNADNISIFYQFLIIKNQLCVVIILYWFNIQMLLLIQFGCLVRGSVNGKQDKITNKSALYIYTRRTMLLLHTWQSISREQTSHCGGHFAGMSFGKFSKKLFKYLVFLLSICGIPVINLKFPYIFCTEGIESAHIYY